MSGKNFKLSFSLFVILAVMMGVVPTFAASAVIGSVAGGTNATIGGQTLLPNTTLFSGDSLKVRDGAAVVALGMGSRMVFGRETVASFERGTDEVTVELGQGNVVMYHPEAGMAMRVKIGDVSVSAGKGYRTLGEVAMVNGVVVVTAKEGMLQVQGPERTVELTKGKTIEITPKSAGSPQPGQGGSGKATSGWTSGEVIAVAGLAAGATGAVIGAVNWHKLNNLKTQEAKTDADALAAAADANAATAAAVAATNAANIANANAIEAGMIAAQTCHQLSPTNPACTFTAH
jgi:hypothetical protein